MEIEAYGKWSHVANLEEDFYKRKSKVHSLELGDKNNKFFCNEVKPRKVQNMITELQCVSGEVVNKQEEIKTEAVKFFSDFLNHEPSDYVKTPIAELRELREFRCSAEECSFVQSEFTVEAVKKFSLQRRLTKLLVLMDSCLKRLLLSFISLNQSAFVKDRLLMENLLFALELVKSYHKPSVSKMCCKNRHLYRLSPVVVLIICP